MAEDTVTFEGFEEPTANFTRIPNAFLEAMSIIDTMGEMKVVYYILRHTWGFQDDYKRITLDEFQHGRKRKNGSRLDEGTGLAKSTIIDGLRRAQEHGFIEVETDNRDAARVRKYYSLCMKGESGVQKSDTCGTEVIPPGLEVIQRSEKETLKRYSKKVPPPNQAEQPPVKANVSRLLRSTITQGEDDSIQLSALAEYIGQQLNSPVPAGGCNKLAIGYTEQLSGGRQVKHPSPDQLWLEHPLFPEWVDMRIRFVKGKGGSNAAQRSKAVNAICQYKGSQHAWLEWLATQAVTPRFRSPEEVEAEMRRKEPGVVADVSYMPPGFRAPLAQEQLRQELERQRREGG